MRVLALLLASLPALAQTTPAKPVFEVASIKGPDPDYSGSGWSSNNDRLTVHNMTLRSLIMASYGVQQYQIAGGPKWLDGDRFVIVAKLEGRGSGEEIRVAMQSLLAERFQVAIHKETKEMTAYSLTVAKGGFKLHPVEDTHHSSTNGSRGKAVFKGVSMARLAIFLSRHLDRPVVDTTGVQGVYDFTLEWSADDGADGGPSLFSVLQEQLGLKLESRREPVEILVIDHAERPDEN